jgi:3-oxoacyl-[acyl-carrier protein] reductase
VDLGLRNRACVVTGASRGIGRATALALASEGAGVLLVGRREDGLAETKRACLSAGGRAEVLPLDVTDADAGERIVEACLTQFERLDALVNNAGTSAVRSLEELTDEEWQSQWELHVMAPMRLMRTAAPTMADRGWGRIVNVCSSSGKRPSGTNMAYSVSKAAQLSLSRAFADMYAARGVLVNAVAPGPVMADQVARARGITREQALEQTAARVPVGRLAAEYEIAAVIVFLCGEAASYIAGAAWSVDGGAVPVII